MTRVWVGTSGFSYREWKGSFYPESLPSGDYLKYYASRLNSVEIDSTFYRMPTAEALGSWNEATPGAFRFVIKANQKITHRERLRVPSGAVDRLNELVRVLDAKLGLVLYQLPPFFRCDPSRLQAFLEVLPPDIPAAMEFRHPTWFNPEVYRLLESRGVALCIVEADEGCSPAVLTATRTCVRLRRSQYGAPEQFAWRTRWQDWARSGVEVFAYVKHKDNPHAPQIALEFARDL